MHFVAILVMLCYTDFNVTAERKGRREMPAFCVNIRMAGGA